MHSWAWTGVDYHVPVIFDLQRDGLEAQDPILQASPDFMRALRVYACIICECDVTQHIHASLRLKWVRFDPYPQPQHQPSYPNATNDL